jgi:hypothetical protein
LTIYFAIAGLDNADKLASAVGAVVGLVGLGVSVYGLASTRRTSATSPPAGSSPGQSVDDSTVGGGVAQVKGVSGSVRIGAAPPSTGAAAPSGRTPRSATPPAAPGGSGQSVTGSQVHGSVNQVDGVGGDVEIDR